jgi:hypothetical protein
MGWRRDSLSIFASINGSLTEASYAGAVRGLVGIEGGVVSGVINLDSPGWRAGLETTP